MHEKFDTYRDEEKMMRTLPQKDYDVANLEWMDNVQLSTDFSEEEDALFYRKYKMVHHRRKFDIRKYNEEIADLMEKATINETSNEVIGYYSDGEPIYEDYMAKLLKTRHQKYLAEEEIHPQLETRMAKMKHQKFMKKVDYEVFQKDDIYGDYLPKHDQSKMIQEDSSILLPELKRVILSGRS